MSVQFLRSEDDKFINLQYVEFFEIHTISPTNSFSVVAQLNSGRRIVLLSGLESWKEAVDEIKSVINRYRI